MRMPIPQFCQARRSGAPGGDQQVLPLQGIAGGAEPVGTGQFDECLVEGANLVGIGYSEPAAHLIALSHGARKAKGA